jgi:hypothetical protein
MNESYCDISFADEYMEGRIESATWDTSIDNKKNRALISATRLIDSLSYTAQKKVSTQALQFPRTDQDDVPVEIKYACCEIAYALLDGRDVEFDAELEGHTGVSMESTRIGIDADYVDYAKIHNIPSSVAWGYLLPFLREGKSITLRRA